MSETTYKYIRKMSASATEGKVTNVYIFALYMPSMSNNKTPQSFGVFASKAFDNTVVLDLDTNIPSRRDGLAKSTPICGPPMYEISTAVYPVNTPFN